MLSMNSCSLFVIEHRPKRPALRGRGAFGPGEALRKRGKGALLLIQRLHLDGLVHHGGVIIGRVCGQDLVDGGGQAGVALLDRDAEVGLFFGDVEIVAAAR